MKRAALGITGMLMSLLVLGCQHQLRPSAGMSAAEVRVIAKPKPGAAQPFERVPVYDAAPQPVEASGAYERVDYSRLSDIIVWLEPSSGTGGRGVDGSVTLEVDPDDPSPVIRPGY